jgi:hypothetical protein
MRRILVFAATAALVMTASAATALAAGQTLCSNGPGKGVDMPQANGQCKNGETALTLATESEVTALQTRVSALETDNTTLKSEVSTLESDNSTFKSDVSALQTTLSKVSYSDSGLNGKPTLTITGANLQIVSGSGSTNGPVNGEGNLIIGYDENPTGQSQTGSHDLILGSDQSFTSYGGLIAGQSNRLSGPFADVFGIGNEASGIDSSVTGGLGNKASGNFTSVSGGFDNKASGGFSSVSGGESNTASLGFSSVSGGQLNTASGADSSVSGGRNNTASGFFSSILGGNSITVATTDGMSP